MHHYTLQLKEFAKMIRQAPVLLSLLLEQEGQIASSDICYRLNKYYQNLDQGDFSTFYFGEPLPPEREKQLLDLSGLDPELGSLPAALYSRYCDRVEKEMSTSGDYALSDEEIVFQLTGGNTDFEFIYALHDEGHYSICHWDADTGYWLTHFHRIGSVNDQCLKYLRSIGKVLRSRHELVTKPEEEGWPNSHIARNSNAWE